MIVVLDASAGIEVALGNKNSNDYREVLESAERVITTDLYKAETANVLWKYHKAKLLDTQEAMERLNFSHQLIDEFFDIDFNFQEAFLEATRLKHPVYDLLYATLARRMGGVLLTQDKMLRKIARQFKIESF